MQLTGTNFLGSKTSPAGTTQAAKTFRGVNAATGEQMEPPFHQATAADIDAALLQAEKAFVELRKRPAADRAAFLNAIAAELETIGADLSARITAETALPAGRNAGELGRTTGQLRLFAKLITEGWWVDARIDHGDPARTPAPKPDVRRMHIALGPVAIFGASNFPQAFSVAGGDTVSALAAGCPVVIKAHPAHPGTSEMVMRAMLAAAAKTNMPEGIVSMIHGIDPSVSIELVKHPLTRAVGFTGSLRAGRALMDAAASRANPIPVYAEMGSTNPLFILPGALQERGAKIAEGLKGSVTMGVGQFCTKPGIVVMLDSPAAREFVESLGKMLSEAPAATMLNANICKSFQAGQKKFGDTPALRRVTPPPTAKPDAPATQVTATLFSTTADQFLADHALREELFGPSTIVVLAKNSEQLEQLAKALEGQLTATLHGTAADLNEFRGLIDLLAQKAGRVLFNNFPTGVEVCHAMQHGGPYPATSDGRSTSVGTAAICRFARPVAYQDCPDALLPVELQEANPLKMMRLVDGVWKAG